MDADLATQRRLAALLAWKDQLPTSSSAKGITEYDLKRIAESPVIDAVGITRLSLINRRLVWEHAAELAAQLIAADSPQSVDLQGSSTNSVSSPASRPESGPGTGPGTGLGSGAGTGPGTGPGTVREPASGSGAGAGAGAGGKPDIPSEAGAGTASGTEPGTSGRHIEYPAFAPMDLTRALDERRAGPISDHATSHGVRLTWAPLPGNDREVIYRVISTEQAPPPSPEKGQLVATLQDAQIEDNRLFATSVRYYRVWANAGQTIAEACQSQPILVAQGAVVSPVQDWRIIERDGQVIGRWSVPPGFDRVVVHRRSPGASFSQSHELLPERPEDLQEQGFVDKTGAPGARYEYAVYVCAWVASGGATTRQLSAPVTDTIEIPADPEMITDLKGTERKVGEQSVFDVSWTRPSHGQVHLYLTAVEPETALRQRPLPADSLETTVLAKHARIQHPAARSGETMFIEGVAWPATWYRAYVTPVTQAGDRVQVGVSYPFIRTDPVRDAVIRERVDSQIAVFDWPQGASQVAAFKTPPGHPWTSEQNQEEAAIDRDGYDRLGGLLLNLRGVPVDINLVPRAWEQREQIVGPPLRVHYPGIYVLSYDVVQEYLTRRVLLRKRREPDGRPRIMLHSQSERDLSDGAFLTLVHNPHRIPLSSRDGTLLQTKAIPVIHGGQQIHVFDLPETGAGFVRLFAEAHRVAQRIALLDPDVSKLRR